MGNADSPVVILGAGRQGRNVADILHAAGRVVRGFLDDTKAVGSSVVGIPVLGGFDHAADRSLADAAFHVALGNPIARQRLVERLLAQGGMLASAIHPSAALSPSADLGAGIYIAPFVRVASSARLRTGCIVESHSVIGSDSVIGPYALVAAHCSLTAGCRIGAGAFIGTQSSVLGVSIGARSIVGAGAVVTRDLPENVRAFGAPAETAGPADWSRPPV